MEPTRNYVFRQIVSESILVPISPNLKERDCLYVMNPVGRVIYEELQKGGSADSAAARVREEFELSAETDVTGDVAAFITQLTEIEAVKEASREVASGAP